MFVQPGQCEHSVAMLNVQCIAMQVVYVGQRVANQAHVHINGQPAELWLLKETVVLATTHQKVPASYRASKY